MIFESSFPQLSMKGDSWIFYIASTFASAKETNLGAGRGFVLTIASMDPYFIIIFW
jgi:hypothetical protein